MLSKSVTMGCMLSRFLINSACHDYAQHLKNTKSRLFLRWIHDIETIVVVNTIRRTYSFLVLFGVKQKFAQTSLKKIFNNLGAKIKNLFPLLVCKKVWRDGTQNLNCVIFCKPLYSKLNQSFGTGWLSGTNTCNENNNILEIKSL